MREPGPLRVWAGKMCSRFARRPFCIPGHQRTNGDTECHAAAYAAADANGNILDCCANPCDSCSDSNPKTNSHGKILTTVIFLCFVESSGSNHHDTFLTVMI
jgi:hypothetical protein